MSFRAAAARMWGMSKNRLVWAAWAGTLVWLADQPTVAGYKKFDLYEATTKTQGDPAKAKQALQQCGQPNGFSTGIAYRSDRPTETQGAQALQQALSAVGNMTASAAVSPATTGLRRHQRHVCSNRVARRARNGRPSTAFRRSSARSAAAA